jgi:WD40 repeat protein
MLWDTHTGERLYTLEGHKNSVSSVAFPSKGEILASGSFDHTIKLWNVRTGECIRTLDGHSNWVNSVAFSCDGEIIVSGSRDRTLKLWDARTGECIKTLHGHTSWVSTVAFSFDGKIIASGSSDDTIQLWDVALLRMLENFMRSPLRKHEHHRYQRLNRCRNYHPQSIRRSGNSRIVKKLQIAYYFI